MIDVGGPVFGVFPGQGLSMTFSEWMTEYSLNPVANSANYTEPVSGWRHIIWGNAPCANTHGLPIFNDNTKFFSYCFISGMVLTYSVMMLFPTVWRIMELHNMESGPRSSHRQLTTLLALLCPALWVGHALLSDIQLTPADLVSIPIGLVIARLHSVQDGRVVVCCSELVLYWLVMAFGYLGYALDSVLREGVKPSCLIITAAVVAWSIFIIQITEKRPEGDQYFDHSSFLDKATLSFANSVLERGATGDLDHQDLPFPPVGSKAYLAYDEFSQRMALYPDSKYRILWAFRKLVGYDLLVALLLDVVASSCKLLSPQIMLWFLRSVGDYSAGRAPLYKAYYVALLLGIVPTIGSVVSCFYNVRVQYVTVRAKGALLATMYRKALHLSPKAKEIFISSKIMNLMSVDADQTISLITDFTSIFIQPFIGGFALLQLWKLIGPTLFASAVVYAVALPLQGFASSHLGKIIPEMLKVKDLRLKLISNALRCIKSLKLHAWEVPYFQRICAVRDEELRYNRIFCYVVVLFSVIYNQSGDMVAAAIFVAFLWFKQGALTPYVVFPTLLLLNIISLMSLELPLVIVTAQQGFASQHRINELFSESSATSTNYEHSNESVTSYEEDVVVAENIKVSWNGEDVESKIALNRVSFRVGRGDLVCIVGRVGCGKTALLKTLAGGMCILNGKVSLRGSIAICTQEIWLQNASLRENILFGETYDEEWYKRVITACELDQDIRSLENGDTTNVGERGISLSGGQKARVSLARAVYSRADIFLLDDVLSAVDEHVSAALIKQLFSSTGLLANRAVILATNNVKVLSHSSCIIALNEKKIAEMSSFREVVQKCEQSLVYKLIQEFGHAEELEQDHEVIEHRPDVVREREASDKSAFPVLLSEKPNELVKFDIHNENKDEEKEQHVPSLKIYLRYYFLDIHWVVWFVLVCMIFIAFLRNGQVVFLGHITSFAFTNLYDARYYMFAYLMMTFILSSLIALMIILTDIVIGIHNARILHNRMLWCVLRAPMTFFDKTPLGLLINRFTSDITKIDSRFADIFGIIARGVFTIVTNLLTILLGAPQVLLIVGPLIWVANNTRRLYVPTQRKVTRIYTASNSPILNHVEDSLKGQATISAFGRTSRYVDIFDERIDYWIKAAFFKGNLQQWLQFRIEMFSTVLGFTAALGLTQLIGYGLVSASYAGVVLNFSDRVGVMVGQLLQNLAEAEMSGISLERILEFIDMAQEAPDSIEATKPDESWPTAGELTFDGFSAKYYSDGPEILKNLTFKINSGEKIGVVGRTGSGKSTLTLAIFRLLEASEGHIELDNIDTSILGLSDLRSRMSIVPQDAQIFDATVRENLDPFKKCDDARLWEILEHCHLKTLFKEKEGLDTELNDSGSTLSRGQCQLLCLGRALVHKSKLLVLDEATASVDHETDKIIQETIRSQMSDRTIITIAHRLNTIMDSDRIIVLDQGVIKEFDTPQRLLDMKGLFYNLLNTELKKEGDSGSDLASVQ